MNRVIKFRGKRLTDGEFHYGSLLQEESGRMCIYDNVRGIREVDPNTMGQFTGLHDANGKEIYEGDILRVLGNKITLTVVFDKAAFKFAWNDLSGEFFPAEWVSNCTIIGNVHDNPELLKGGNYGTDDNH